MTIAARIKNGPASLGEAAADAPGVPSFPPDAAPTPSAVSPSEDLAEVSHLSTGSRPENEADGVSPMGQRSENAAPSVPLSSAPGPEGDPTRLLGPVALERGRAEAGGSQAQVASPGAEEPYGVAQVVTPSGLEIYYQAGPKRLYRLKNPVPLSIMGGESYEWREVPSMSDILDVLEKGGLSWWGMGVGIAGLQEILHFELEAGNPAIDRWFFCSVDEVVEELKARKLTVNHVRDNAAARGTNVHDALEVWAKTGKLAPPNAFEESERGYVKGLNEFLTDSKATPIVSEVMVASMQYGYAGRFDLVADIPDETQVFTHITPKGRGDKRETLPEGRWLLDLKTSKNVYASHKLQVAGYDLAYRESYGEGTDFQGVINVTADGRYKLVHSNAEPEHFLAVKEAYDALQEIS